MDAQLLTAVLASSVVAAIISGVFGYLNATRVERLKHDLLAGQERAKRLADAHVELLAIKTSGPFDFQAAQKNPTGALTQLVVSMTADFDTASQIYERIRPLLKPKYRDDVEMTLNNAREVNEQASARLRSGQPFDQKPVLEALVGARARFIETVKAKVEAAYAEATGV